MLVLLAGAWGFCSGCATGGKGDDNMSERPWNAPKDWENGLPYGMMQGR